MTPPRAPWVRDYLNRQSGVVAIESALIIAAFSIALLVGTPELVNVSRADSQLKRSAALTADLLGMKPTLSASDFANAVQMAQWALRPFPDKNLAFLAQSFSRPADGALPVMEWSLSHGSACSPESGNAADMKSLISANSKSVITLSACYRVPSVTGFLPDMVVYKRSIQDARALNVTYTGGDNSGSDAGS